MGILIIVLSILLMILVLIELMISRYLNSTKYKLLYMKRRKNINYMKVIKVFVIVSIITLISPIINGEFEWYYVSLPISVVLFLVTHSIYHISLEKGYSEFSDITDIDIKVYEREDTINKILK